MQPLPAPSATSVDALMEQGLRAKGLVASPAADRRILIRRLFYDLTGLPPTSAEVDAFVAGKTTTETLINQLLASTHFGERWARHGWMSGKTTLPVRNPNRTPTHGVIATG